MGGNAFGKNSTIEMHELAFHKENETEVIIGRTETGTFIVLPNIGHEIIEYLQQGKTIGETEQILFQKYAEPIDVTAFVDELIQDYKFVYRLDGIVVNRSEQAKEHFAWIPAKTGRIFFNPLSYFIYFAILLSAACIVVFHPKYIPSYRDFLLASSMPLNIVISIIAVWFFLFLHEFAHLIAARSLGVKCRIGLGHRLIFPVAETDMSGIVLVSSNKRYGAYTAGMCWDIVFLSTGIWLEWLHDLNLIVIRESVLDTIRLINCQLTALILFQFLFFMKTDLYYVFTNFFRCPNLLEHTFLYFKRFFIKNTDLTEQWDEIPLREKIIIYGFSWFYMVGVLFTSALLILFQIPNLYKFLTDSIVQISRTSLLSWSFAAGITLIIICMLPNAILIWSWLKSIRNSFGKNSLKGGEQDEKN